MSVMFPELCLEFEIKRIASFFVPKQIVGLNLKFDSLASQYLLIDCG